MSLFGWGIVLQSDMSWALGGILLEVLSGVFRRLAWLLGGLVKMISRLIVGIV